MAIYELYNQFPGKKCHLEIACHINAQRVSESSGQRSTPRRKPVGLPLTFGGAGNNA